MVKCIVRHRPCDVFEIHLAAFDMDDDDPFAWYEYHGGLPVSSGAAYRPEGSGERYVRALCPDAEIVRHVADVGAHRPREVRVAFGASCTGDERRVFLRNPSHVRKRLIEPGRERKGTLTARVSVERPSPPVHDRTIADLDVAGS
jgi:hypothetical protein